MLHLFRSRRLHSYKLDKPGPHETRRHEEVKGDEPHRQLEGKKFVPFL